MTPENEREARPSRRWVLGWTQRCLLVVGVVALGTVSGAMLDARIYAAIQGLALDVALRSNEFPAGGRARALAMRSDLVGRIEIPRLDVAAIVAEGEDPLTLRRAVGHVPGTAFPGEPGNAVLAGHRDLHFRSLGDIRPEDRIRVETPDGIFLYRVESTQVVKPDRVDLLAPTPRPMLTLITCYPFNYVGPAPERFVVRAPLAAAHDS